MITQYAVRSMVFDLPDQIDAVGFALFVLICVGGLLFFAAWFFRDALKNDDSNKRN